MTMNLSPAFDDSNPRPITIANADVEITTPFGIYSLDSGRLERASEFFQRSMSDRWNTSRMSSPDVEASDESGIRFRYWMPEDSYIVDRNRCSYTSVAKQSEVHGNAYILDLLLKSIYAQPIEHDISSLNALVEVADAYDALPCVAPTVSSFWMSLEPPDLEAAIRADPWQFLLSAFQIQDPEVFASALAHCVGIWHLLPPKTRAQLHLESPEDPGDDVMCMRFLPYSLCALVTNTQDSIVSTQKAANKTLAAIAAEEEKDSLSMLDMMLDSTWESATSYASRLSREVARSFISRTLSLAADTPRAAYHALHRGLLLKPDEFFACTAFSMEKHQQELEAVDTGYCNAMMEIAGKYKDPDLNLQVHRFHKQLAEFLGEVKKAVEPLVDERSAEDVRYLMCGKIEEGKYPWLPMRPSSADSGIGLVPEDAIETVGFGACG